MSTIALRDGIFAADTRAFSGSPRFIGHKSKIFQLKDGTTIGTSTNQPGFAEKFAEWFADGADSNPAEIPIVGEGGFEALVVTAEGDVLFFNDGFYPSGPLDAEFFAIGSGAEYALGAMERGATAEEAVVVAAKYDAWTDAPVMAVSVPVKSN